MDMKVKKFNFWKDFRYFFQSCKCPPNDISFGSVDDILKVSSEQEVSQPANIDSTCSEDIRCPSIGTKSDEKEAMAISEIKYKIKVINFIFLSKIFIM